MKNNMNMEELQVIETTTGRQFKPWATKDDVQDPASVTGIASEIASGKQAIAAAINAKGGSAYATESFSELAEDIQNTPTSGVLSSGILQTEPFSFLDYVCKQGAYPFTEIDDDSVTVISRHYAFIKQTQLLKVRMSALGSISGGNVFHGCSSLQEIELPNLTTISGSNVFQDCSSLREIELPNLTTFSGYSAFTGCHNLKIAKFPKCSNFSGQYIFEATGGLINIVFGTLTNFYSGGLFYGRATNLRNITIGQDTNISLPFHEWTATNVIAEGQSGIDELNSNLYNNLLTKLYDHSQDGVTRTLRLGWLANVSAENIAYANAKGWTWTT